MLGRSILCAVLATAACGGDEVANLDVTLDAAGAAQTLTLPTRAHVTLSASVPAGMVDFELDCHPPADTPDVVGVRLAVDAPGLGLTAAPERAGYVRARARAAGGPLTITVEASGGPASCAVRLTPATGCPLVVFRSVNVDHDHVAAGTIPASWEAFPVSGDHYPVWAPWSTDYPKAIRTGYLLHDLEHGGLVLSYRCGSAADSAACTAAQADVVAARAAFGATRTLDTPDPSQPAMYAVRAWRWGLSADCYDAPEVAAFMSARFRHGREDVDADSPTVFHPTQ